MRVEKKNHHFEEVKLAFQDMIYSVREFLSVGISKLVLHCNEMESNAKVTCDHIYTKTKM